MTDAKPTQSRKASGGCLYAVIFVGVLVFISALTINTCKSPRWQAKQELKDNPCRAARHFAEGVREGGKYAMSTLHELSKIDQPCALVELIGLMDIPNGRGLNRDHRIFIWDEVRKRAGDPPPLPYDPSASLEVRIEQRSAWIAWYNKKFEPPPSSSLPSTAPLQPQ